MMRAMVAALAAAMVVSGCATGGEGSDVVTTTSSAAAEASGNPWDLPLEARPPLFDPCAEISPEALAEAGYANQDRIEDHTYDRDGVFKACDWGDDEVLFGVYATWDDRATVLSRNDTTPAGSAAIAGRPAERLTGVDSASDSECHSAFFTSRGTVVISTVFTSALNSYQGEPFADICSVLDAKIQAIASEIPEGDYR